MAKIEDGIFARLSGFAGLGVLVDARIFNNKAPQETDYPLLIFQEISGTSVMSHQGLSCLAFDRFQFAAYANSAEIASDIRQQVKAALAGFVGTVGGVEIQSGIIVGKTTSYDNDFKKYRATVDINIGYREVVP